jgi:UTP-glucose-1-phosphate uridylyltransferase
MEERLEMVKRMMELEKDKRSQKMATSIDGSSMWRSATTQKSIKGYSDMVLTHHRKVQPELPPTTLILKDDT